MFDHDFDLEIGVASLTLCQRYSFSKKIIFQILCLIMILYIVHDLYLRMCHT